MDPLQEMIARIQAGREKHTTMTPLEASARSLTDSDCPVCHGSGWVFWRDDEGREYGKRCECGVVERQIMENKLEFANIPAAFKALELKTFRLDVYRQDESRQLNPTGQLETWENPLVSDVIHAANLADWIGDYMRADREYDLQYRGEPRLDANDIAFLENKYVPDLLLRVYEHTLKFDGAFSGTIKARRDMGNVAAAKNRLASR